MTNIRILQGYFDETSKRYLDPSAEAVDVSFNLDNPLYEYAIFKMLQERGLMEPGSPPMGFVSWKFETKTLVPLTRFAAFCEKAFAEGTDVAFINPMIAAEALYKDIWEQGEHVHSGMQTVIEAIFTQEERAKLDLMTKRVIAFCNYFVGNAKFWAAYMAFCGQMLDRLEALKESNPLMYELIHGSARYDRKKQADFRPFLIERLFTCFLLLRPDIRSTHFEYGAEIYEKKFGLQLGKHLHLLSALKNHAFDARDLKQMMLWNESRLKILATPLGIERMDDPQPGKPQVAAVQQPGAAASAERPPLKIGILQGYFDEASRRYVDPAAIPVDISFNIGHPLYEYNIFKTLLSRKVMDPSTGPVGLVSWKFETKTLVPLGEFATICERAFTMGIDVFFINPMIGAEAIYANVWEQGEHVGHAGMLAIFHALFSEAQVARMKLMPASAFAFCNYFVGNAKFWSSYVKFCDGILKKIEALKKQNPQVYALIYGSAHYHRNEAADFRPFIVERLLSSFLQLNPEIRRVQYIYSSDTYEKKFGETNGKYLYLLSNLKNNGIYSGNQEQLKKWDEMRQVVLKEPVQIWLQDDPQPKQD